jgi:pilus assembly protein CpaE
MRAVVGYGPDADRQQLRQIVLGSGLECGADDCVAWQDLSARLGQVDADFVLVKIDPADEQSWTAAEEARGLTTAPVLAIGPAGNADLSRRIQRLGAVGPLDEQSLPRSLDAALDDWFQAQKKKTRRGKVFSVFSPTPGSGATTVAANLAGAFSRKYVDDVALVDLTSDFGDLAVLLNAEFRHTAQDVCRRCATLDRTSLRASLADHSSGLKVLLNASDQPRNEYLSMDAGRRIAILTRMTIGYTVLALDSRLTDVEKEAMRLSDAVVYVVRPDVPAVRRAALVLNEVLAAGIDRERICLVVNRFGQPGQLALKQLESTLDMRAAHLIPDDPHNVNRAANYGSLLQERARFKKITRRFASLANALNAKA